LGWKFGWFGRLDAVGESVSMDGTVAIAVGILLATAGMLMRRKTNQHNM